MATAKPKSIDLAEYKAACQRWLELRELADLERQAKKAAKK